MQHRPAVTLSTTDSKAAWGLVPHWKKYVHRTWCYNVNASLTAGSGVPHHQLLFSHVPTVKLILKFILIGGIGDLDTIGCSAVERFHNKLVCVYFLPIVVLYSSVLNTTVKRQQSSVKILATSVLRSSKYCQLLQ